MTLYLQKLARRAMGQEEPVRTRSASPYAQLPPLAGISSDPVAIDIGQESSVRTASSYSERSPKMPFTAEVHAGSLPSADIRFGVEPNDRQDRLESASSMSEDSIKSKFPAGEDSAIAQHESPAQMQEANPSTDTVKDSNSAPGFDSVGVEKGAPLELPSRKLLRRITDEIEAPPLSSGSAGLSRLGKVLKSQTHKVDGEEQKETGGEHGEAGGHRQFRPEPLLPLNQWADDMRGLTAGVLSTPYVNNGGSVEETTEVHVHIGRIEVTAVHEAAPGKAAARRRQPPMSLDDYLARRHGRHS